MRKGFALPLILAVVVVGVVVVGAIAYFQLKPKPKSQPQLSQAAVPSPTQATSSAKSTESLKQFSGVLYSSFNYATNKGDLQKFTFNYPSNWKVTEDDSKNKNSPGHFYLIEGTNSFTIQLSEIPGGIGGACGDTTVPPDLIVKAEKITINDQLLYLTSEGSVSKQEVKDTYLDTDPNVNCMEGIVPLKIKPSNANSGSINFMVMMSFQKVVNKDYFLNSEEYKTAKQILSTFKFLD